MIDEKAKLCEMESLDAELHYWAKALHILSLGPEEQCEIMGNFNVAWELKRDVSRGFSTVERASSRLTTAQEIALKQLVDLMNRIPSAVLAEATNPEANLRAMHHQAWDSPRKHALIVMRTFGIGMPA